jgi:hypothetical protein
VVPVPLPFDFAIVFAVFAATATNRWNLAASQQPRRTGPLRAARRAVTKAVIIAGVIAAAVTAVTLAVTVCQYLASAV